MSPMESIVPYIGYIAASLTTLSFIPQMLKVVRDKETQGVSLLMYVMFATGLCLWLLYGVLMESSPIVIANAVTLMLVIPIIVTKIRLG